LVLSRLSSCLLDSMNLPDECRSLVIVPHGLLHYLPFHAFFDGASFLIERVAVTYAPSAALYRVCSERARGRRTGPSLVLANSASGQIPHTLAEAIEVGAVLHSVVHREESATRALIESAGRRASLIHIATHGTFRADAPLFSSIELADGPLTTADVYGLKLRASLVTLSACETGRSEVGGGDELVGIVRAFLYAGAGALLLSQWRVEDASTATLMATFYRQLAEGDDPAAALRTAQCEAIRTTPLESAGGHPFLWAGFQLIGGSHTPNSGARRPGRNRDGGRKRRQ